MSARSHEGSECVWGGGGGGGQTKADLLVQARRNCFLAQEDAQMDLSID